MSKIILIRHGQASFGKSDYDKLSPLGLQQAAWLGEHFNAIDHPPSTILEGNLTRHQQTSDQLSEYFPQISDRIKTAQWNEFDFDTLLKLYLTQYPNEMPSKPEPKIFFGLLRKAIHLWSEDKIHDDRIETWQEFSDRVALGLDHARTLAKEYPVLVVTSGGAIAMALRHLLGLDINRMIDINMQTKNTSLTELYASSEKTHLVSFNVTPHLEHIDRRDSITSL